MNTHLAAAAASSEAPAELLAVRGVTKRYGPTLALDEVDLQVRRGDIHGLLGHNGSGKSTLIKVLAGVVSPDSGSIDVLRQPLDLPLRPADSEALGLRFVHQNLGLVPTLSVAENLFLKQFSLDPWARPVRWRRLYKECSRLLAEHDIDVDPRASLDRLSPVDWARIAVVRAIASSGSAGSHGQPHLVVLDEPTVFLPRHEVATLFALLRRLAARGTGILLVSHRMDELLHHTDRVTVLRDGRAVGTRVTAQTTEQQLIELMVGREWRDSTPGQPAAPTPDAPPTARIRELHTQHLRRFTMDIEAGAIVGLTGLLGSGYEEVLHALFGISPIASGVLQIGDHEQDIKRLTPQLAMQLGIGLVPAERLRQGLSGRASIEENLTLPLLRGNFRGGLLRLRSLSAAADRLIAEFDVQPGVRSLETAALSGGNQQKVLLAKWLQSRPRLLLLHEPTQGVDIAARHEIWRMVRSMAAAGSAVIVASTDYEELASLCSSVAVVGDGQVAGTLDHDRLSSEDIATECLKSTRTAA